MTIFQRGDFIRLLYFISFPIVILSSAILCHFSLDAKVFDIRSCLIFMFDTADADALKRYILYTCDYLVKLFYLSFCCFSFPLSLPSSIPLPSLIFHLHSHLPGFLHFTCKFFNIIRLAVKWRAKHRQVASPVFLSAHFIHIYIYMYVHVYIIFFSYSTYSLSSMSKHRNLFP